VTLPGGSSSQVLIDYAANPSTGQSAHIDSAQEQMLELAKPAAK
jgi:hypothetical protein